MNFLATVEGAKHYGIWSSIGGLFISAFHILYGDSEVTIAVSILLVLVVGGDWIAGSKAAEKDGIYASEYGIAGVGRTAFILMLPAIGHQIDKISNLPGLIFGLISAGIVYHTLRSMTANAVRAGWDRWVPTSVIDWVASEIEHKVARSMERKKLREKMLKDDDHLPKE